MRVRFTIRGPVYHLTWLTVAGSLARGLWRALRWAARYPILPVGAILTAIMWWAVWVNAVALIVAVFGIGFLAVGGWAEKHGTRSWGELRAGLASWRRLRWYRARWEQAMAGCGLVRDGYVPELRSHAFGGWDHQRDVDVLTVVMAPGQLPGDWRTVAARLASAWGVRSVRALHVSGRTELVTLQVRTGTAPALRWQPPAVPVEEEGTELAPVRELPAARTGAFPRTPRGTT
jgi:hypothetical protein